MPNPGASDSHWAIPVVYCDPIVNMNRSQSYIILQFEQSYPLQAPTPQELLEFCDYALEEHIAAGPEDTGYHFGSANGMVWREELPCAFLVPNQGPA